MRFFHYALGTVLTLAALTSNSIPVVEAVRMQSKAGDFSATATLEDTSDLMSTEGSVTLAQTSAYSQAISTKGAQGEVLTA